LLDRVDGDLSRLARLSVEEIRALKVKGIGKARAVAIVAALELARRRPAMESGLRGSITSSKDIYELMAPRLADLGHEEFHVIFLNRANKIIANESMSTGGLSGTVADPRRIFKRALDHKASYIIACHNHPSGNLKPSPADLKLTRNLADSGKLLEIQLLDHVIITDGQYYSFADDGKL
jgi:DNA repair protein RadC